MPYTIIVKNKESGKPYCVVKLPHAGKPGETITCHETREKAEKHLAALRANVKE